MSEKGNQFTEQLYWHVPVCPTMPHHGTGAIDAGAIAVGRYLDLDPVQGRAVDLIELSPDPFEHVLYGVQE